MHTYVMGTRVCFTIEAANRHEAETRLQGLCTKVAELGADVETDPDVVTFFEDEDQLYLTTSGYQTLAEIVAEETKSEPVDEVVLHVAQDMQDLLYQVPISLMREFRNRLLANKEDTQPAWEWFLSHVDYKGDESKPIKYETVKANHGLCVLFLDWDQLEECIAEWAEELDK